TLDAFARAGGIVAATRRLPARAPGFQAGDADHEAVRSLAQRLFQGPGAPGIFVASDDALGAALAQRLRPDVVFAPAAPEIGVVHRRSEAGDIYFLANTGKDRQRVTATFRIAGKQADAWDPLTGQVTAARVVDLASEATPVALDLEPHGAQV